MDSGGTPDRMVASEEVRPSPQFDSSSRSTEETASTPSPQGGSDSPELPGGESPHPESQALAIHIPGSAEGGRDEEEDEGDEGEFRYERHNDDDDDDDDQSRAPTDQPSETTETTRPPLSPSLRSSGSQSPQTPKSPYSKWDPRYEAWARATAAATTPTASTAAEEQSPLASSKSSPVIVSIPDSPVAHLQQQRLQPNAAAPDSEAQQQSELRTRTQAALKKLSTWLPKPEQPERGPVKVSTAESAIRAIQAREARVQRSIRQEAAPPPPAPPVSGSQVQLSQPVTTPDEPRPSRPPASSPTTRAYRAVPAVSDADARVASLKHQLEATEQRAQHLDARLREERIARGKLEDERDRIKSIAISLRRASEQAGQDKSARQAAEVELARLRSSAQERDKEFEETRAALANAQKEVERLETERKDAIRAIVQAEDELHGRILEDGNELIRLREQVVALLLEQTELHEELERLTHERDALIGRAEEASASFERLKAAAIRMRADFKAQLEAKDEELEAVRREGERPDISDIQERHSTLQTLVRRADSATQALRRHVQAVMLDLGPVSRVEVAGGERGVLSKMAMLELLERADSIFATRAALVIPPGCNASLTTAEPEPNEPTPVQRLNELQSRYARLQARHQEAEQAKQRLVEENARLRHESVEMHEAVVKAHELIKELSGL
ncbi:hypothetical protein JCM3774_000665 [Rhodotorula dairenensis]